MSKDERRTHLAHCNRPSSQACAFRSISGTNKGLHSIIPIDKIRTTTREIRIPSRIVQKHTTHFDRRCKIWMASTLIFAILTHADRQWKDMQHTWVASVKAWMASSFMFVASFSAFPTYTEILQNQKFRLTTFWPGSVPHQTHLLPSDTSPITRLRHKVRVTPDTSLPSRWYFLWLSDQESVQHQTFLFNIDSTPCSSLTRSPCHTRRICPLCQMSLPATHWT